MAQLQINYSGSSYCFDFEDNKEWTVDDHALYTGLLDVMKCEENTHEECRKECIAFAELQKEIKALVAYYEDVEIHVRKIIEHTDEFTAKILIVKVGDVPGFRAMISDGDEDIMELDKRLSLLDDNVKKLKPEGKDLSACETSAEWNNFKSIMNRHYHNYSIQSIDIGSFDKMVQAIYDVFGFMKKQNDDYTYLNKTVVNNYTILLEKAAGLYRVWDEYRKRVMLLERIIIENEVERKTYSLN